MDPAPDEEAAGLVGDLVQAARVPAKRRPFAVKPTVDRLAALAYEHGLAPDTLRTLVADVLTAPGTHLDQASLGSLVRNLYPAGASTVLPDVVLAIVGCLGHGQLKPPLPVQALLLRWLVLAYHMLAAPALAALTRSYAVLFNLLDTAGIRPQLCHVLVLITRRRHVRPFRIQAILQLSRQTGHDPCLVGLLRVFKNYYPEVIVGEATRGRASPFKHPDPQWRTHLDEIRLARQQQSRQHGRSADDLFDDAPASGFRVRREATTTTTTTTTTAANGRRRNPLPTVHTEHAQEESVTLEEIDSAAGLAQHLETLELPSQLVAVLADPLLQKLLLLRPADEATARVENWLAACVVSAARGGGGGDDELMDLLEVVHDYVTSTRTFPPVFHRFFGAILARWDGRAKKRLILETLAFVPVADFADLQATTFGPLEARLLDNAVTSQLDLLAFYTLVLRQWAIAMAATGTGAAAGTRAAASLPALVQHVNRLVPTVLQNATASMDATTPTIAALAVVDFYEELAAVLALRRPDVLAVVQELIPPPAAVFTLHFQHSAAVAARLYAVLAAYKRALERAMAQRPARSSLGAGGTDAGEAGGSPLARPLSDPERARVNLFNGYLMDVCNCLWRSRAFSATDTNALGCRVDAAVVARLTDYVRVVLEDQRDLPLAAVFSLSHAPALCLHAITYLRQLEEEAMDAASSSDGAPPLQRRHAGPVTQAALVQLGNAGGLRITWQAYRSGLLVYLEQQGLGGISALMYNTMKNLMNTRASG